MKLEDKQGIFFYFCLFLFASPIPVSRAEVHDTEHFRILYAGEQNAQYARLTGAYLEEAYALYKDIFEFEKASLIKTISSCSNRLRTITRLSVQFISSSTYIE